MQRIAFTSTVCLFTLVVTGCGLFKKKESQTQIPPDQYYAGSPQETQAAPAGFASTPSDAAWASSGSGSRSHVVQRKETLFSIARQYYNGDQSKWRSIYEANRAEIGDDPNKIRVGQRLTIP